MKKVLNMTYTSSLTDLCEVNSSFDTGILRIAYHGENRNHSNISKEAFERCIKTMYNCPLVCNYDRETDTLGGHDVEVVREDDGGLRLVNVTTPVGCIPESAKYWWDTVEEEDGSTHEYLYTDVLLWKRQEAYKKIKENGITSHSMEINVKDGESIDGIYYIYDFEFTAFCLIGVTPCFESSAVEVFSKQDFKQQLSEMMQDLKNSFNLVNTSNEVDNTHPQNYSTEGGEWVLESKMELLAEYGVDAASLDFSIEDVSFEELKEKLGEMNAEGGNEDAGSNNGEPANDTNSDAFALTSNVLDVLTRALEEKTVEREWGTCRLYWYADSDFDANEVYVWDTNDWLLYGFKYSVDGDAVTIDFDSKKRKKFVIADFEGGEQESPFVQVFEQMEKAFHDNNASWEEKYNVVSETVSSNEKELADLRQFKADTEASISKREKDAVLSNFEDLCGVEEFEALKEHAYEYETDALEEKCYAIRGKNGTTAKFSFDNKMPKLKVTAMDTGSDNEPYGGLFVKYGTSHE